MANLSLIGAIQCQIDFANAITSTQFSINGDRPVTVKFGAQGPIGAARGQEKITGSMTFAIPSTGLEFDFLATLERSGGFAFSFPIGAERHTVFGCLRTKRALSSTMEAGEASFSFDFTATDWIRTA